ncbi:MAG: methyltransferase domain-containing protein [Anaeromicrobium sp.]|jgi:ubiquinone/menaquinone biosynthesis C-methylase UbiE|uniref:DVU_1556 family methyltransferase n=1 Tax=Anaeromicrobium sp. TaxID=1929132 RepID=UPI0025D3AD4C|nr:methyltransferase domain-containing protein [Anaeromicrobium sp.]MCT4594154.1 methyltransferase domain-containing protein [Anaeromicrobium sp.]
MFSCGSNSVYESEHMRNVTGDTIRPGGFDLTDRAVHICNFKNNHRVLDVGCGMGTTVAYLKMRYNLDSVGIDPSKKLLKEGKVKNPNLNLYEGWGEKLPFKNCEMEGVFCECTLSLMEDKDMVMKEIYRVLKDKGYLAISDVYAREPRYINELNELNLKSCLRGIHHVEVLKEKLIERGFEIRSFEDHTNYLKELMVNIIFQYGSMNVFWNKTGNCNIDSNELKRILSKSKVGYFLLIAQKT